MDIKQIENRTFQNLENGMSLDFMIGEVKKNVSEYENLKAGTELLNKLDHELKAANTTKKLLNKLAGIKEGTDNLYPKLMIEAKEIAEGMAKGIMEYANKHLDEEKRDEIKETLDNEINKIQ